MPNLFDRPPPIHVDKLRDKVGSGKSRHPTDYFNLAIAFLQDTRDFLQAIDDSYLQEATDVGATKRTVLLDDFVNKLKDIDEVMATLVMERQRIQGTLDRLR